MWPSAKNVAILLDEQGDVAMAPFRVSYNRQGFGALIEQLEPFKEEVRIGLESTGHYWLALFDKLTEAGFQVSLLNPMQVHAYSRTAIRRRKNDRLDAYWVADYIRIASLPVTSMDMRVL